MPDIITLPFRYWAHATGSRFFLRSNSLSARGMFTATRSVYGPLAQVWVCETTMAVQREEHGRVMGALFASRAGGQRGLMRAGDPMRVRPYLNQITDPVNEEWSDETLFTDGTGWTEGTLPPYATIDEAEPIGSTSFVVAGLPESLSTCFYVGDLLEIRPNGEPAEHGHLYEAVFGAGTDANGKTRVTVRPGLRAGISAGDQVVLAAPTTVFRAIDDEQGIPTWRVDRLAEAGFTLIEHIP